MWSKLSDGAYLLGEVYPTCAHIVKTIYADGLIYLAGGRGAREMYDVEEGTTTVGIGRMVGGAQGICVFNSDAILSAGIAVLSAVGRNPHLLIPLEMTSDRRIPAKLLPKN